MPRRLVISPQLAWLLREQDAVLTVRQAIGCGHTRSSLHHLCAVGRWQRLLPGVLIAHNQEPSRRQRLYAAVLWADGQALVDAESACVWYGIPAPTAGEEVVHLLAPYGTGLRSRDFVVVRRSHTLVEGDRSGFVRYVDPATAAVMAARRGRDARAAAAVLSRPLQEKVVTVHDLVAAHMHAPPRGARVVARALEHLGAGARSPAELVARELFAQRPLLSTALWNPWLRLPDGTLVCPDALFVDAGVIVEINGKDYHAWGAAFEYTEARALRLTSTGLVVAPVTPQRLRGDGRRVLDEVERTVRQHAGRGLPAGVELVDVPSSRTAA